MGDPGENWAQLFLCGSGGPFKIDATLSGDAERSNYLILCVCVCVDLLNASFLSTSISNSSFCHDGNVLYLHCPTWWARVAVAFIYLFGSQGLNGSMWDLVPNPGIELGPLPWEHRVLAIGPSGKSHKWL